jgi:hypothetical protein
MLLTWVATFSKVVSRRPWYLRSGGPGLGRVAVGAAGLIEDQPLTSNLPPLPGGVER